MRESGFDVSFRFGPFGAATHHYAPVCLNSLLYKTEKDLEQISLWLGPRRRRQEMEQARRRAQETDHALSVEPAARNIFRLQLQTDADVGVPICVHVLSAVGGARDAGAGKGGRRQLENI